MREYVCSLGCGAKFIDCCTTCYDKYKAQKALVLPEQLQYLSMEDMLHNFNNNLSHPIKKAVWQERIKERLNQRRK